ncbi:MAG TPA: tetratricopeptide repeat protein [Anaeromyxobacteraceae bacterium]
MEGLDDELLFRLNRGAEQLAQGELEAARESLSRARELRPKDPQVLGLLGQTLYKLARYPEAVEVYARLVDESPVEAAARVNLGLASLKARKHADAVRQLEIALDLNPEHRKAMGYLGLAWLEQGDFARAREWFEHAGSDQMVAKCDELLALATVQPEPAVADAAPAQTGEDDAVAAPAAPPCLLELAASRRVPEPAGGVFTLRDGLLAVSAAGEVLIRCQGLLAVRGQVRLAPELKRFRGRVTDRPFGEGAARVLRASGEGALVLRPAAPQLTVLRLADEAAYLREESLFAFEASLAFENGRVAGTAAPDLNLVHLRGSGDVLLASRGALRGVEVQAGAPVRIPLAALVGFAGALTPRVVPLHDEVAVAGPGAPRVIELVGQGRVLIDEGAAA